MIQFESGFISVGEGNMAVVCADLLGIGDTDAMGCDLTATLTTDTGKAGMYSHPCMGQCARNINTNLWASILFYPSQHQITHDMLVG